MCVAMSQQNHNPYYQTPSDPQMLGRGQIFPGQAPQNAQGVHHQTAQTTRPLPPHLAQAPQQTVYQNSQNVQPQQQQPSSMSYATPAQQPMVSRNAQNVQQQGQYLPSRQVQLCPDRNHVLTSRQLSAHRGRGFHRGGSSRGGSNINSSGCYSPETVYKVLLQTTARSRRFQKSLGSVDRISFSDSRF